MTLETVNVLASLGTFLVILATAIIALGQLRHIRLANQLSGLKSTFDMLQDPSVRELVNFVRHDLALKLQDESFRASLHKIPIDRQEHPELYLCDMYNHVGSFVRSGLIDEDIYLQTEWYNVGLYWGLLKDVVAEGRRERPFIFENFEWLAARASRWEASHPDGDYPRGERRLIGRAS
jgi:hypothetical protein